MMEKVVIAYVIGSAFGVSLWLAASLLTSPTPIVQVDTATGECIRVISENDRYGCNALPEKYTTEYVAPWWMRQEAK